jgi:hypothetical protein
MNSGNMSEQERPWLLAALVLACVAIALAPLALRGTSCGQDFDFHFESWMGVVSQWHQGVLYPHWIASANYGAGEPRFVFYPPLSWALGAFLCVVLPWTWTPFAFTLICLLAMAAACYHMAREWLPPATSALAASLYVVNPYILFVIYERSALGEMLAAAWFPLLILYALRRKPSTPQLALIIALLWLTDAPAGVMASYALAIIVTVAAVSRRSFAPVARAAASMSLGLGLTAFYLIPAIYQQRWVEITRALNIGMRVQDSFLFEHTGMTYHDQVLRSASFVAVWIIVVALLAAIFLAINAFITPSDGAPCKPAVGLSGPATKSSNTLLRPLMVLVALITLLLFPISLPLWYAAPKLRYLQFPWRWLLVLGLIAATFAGEALAALTARIFPPNPDGAPCKPSVGLSGQKRFILPAAAVLALAAITATHAYHSYWQLCDDQDNVRAQLTALDNPGFEGTDEYTPTPADNADIQQGLPPIRVFSSATADQANSSVAENPEWQPSDHNLIAAAVHIDLWRTEHIIASIRSPKPGYVVFRLMDFPAWSVFLNNQPICRPTGGPVEFALGWRRGRARPCGEHRSDGLLAVPIPAGNSTIEIRYATTSDVWAGRIVSLLALAFWLALAAKSRLRRGIMERHASRTTAQ